jgi:hypothetical protein
MNHQTKLKLMKFVVQELNYDETVSYIVDPKYARIFLVAYAYIDKARICQNRVTLESDMYFIQV